MWWNTTGAHIHRRFLVCKNLTVVDQACIARCQAEVSHRSRDIPIKYTYYTCRVVRTLFLGCKFLFDLHRLHLLYTSIQLTARTTSWTMVVWTGCPPIPYGQENHVTSARESYRHSFQMQNVPVRHGQRLSCWTRWCGSRSWKSVLLCHGMKVAFSDTKEWLLKHLFSRFALRASSLENSADHSSTSHR